MSGSPPRVGYLVTRLPALSHTFILREVLGLRARGVQIAIASINDPDRPRAALTPDERAVADETLYVKAAGFGGLLWAHIASLLSHPLSYARGLAAALRLGGSDPVEQLRFWFAFSESLAVARFFRHHGVGHVHAHFASSAARVGLLLSRMGAFSLSLTLHGPEDFSNAHANRLPALIRAARFVVCISSFARSQAMLHAAPEDWSKLEVVRLGVDLELFGGALAEPGDVFTILSVGRLTAAKGQSVLLGAVARLIGAGRRVRLRLVGAGPLDGSLRAQARRAGIEAHVELAGGVDQSRIRDYYRSAHCFCLASFAEGLPVVLMEAMAMGVPCVATQIAGIPELIANGEDGLLVPAGDEESLVRALARLMDDPPLGARLAVSGRSRVAKEYDLSQNVERLAALFARRLAPGAS